MYHNIDKIITPFITGGIIVSGTTYFAEFMDTKMASLFWSSPFTMIPTYYRLWYNKESNMEIALLSLRTAMSLSALFIFFMTHYYATKYLQEHKYAVWYALFIALIVWIIVGYIFYYYIL